MVLVLIAAALVIGIAFFQVSQGLFSALIMALLSILCAAIAFNFYEPLAQWLLYERQPEYADAAALLALFFLSLLVLRILADRFLGANVVMDVWVDRVGGGIIGLVTGMVLVGVLTVALQMLPFGPSIFTYEPYDSALQRDQRLQPFRPDEFTLGLVNMLSAGSLNGEPSQTFVKLHDDLPLELFCARNRVEQFWKDDDKTVKVLVGTRFALPNSLQIAAAYEIDTNSAEAGAFDSVPKNPLLDGNVPDKFVIVRTLVDQNAREEKDNWWRLPGTHFRLVSQNHRSYYPLAARAQKKNGNELELKVPPVEGKLPQITKLFIARPWDNGPSALPVDWVYRIPVGEEPSYMVFRKVAKAEIQKVRKEMPPATMLLAVGQGSPQAAGVAGPQGRIVSGGVSFSAPAGWVPLPPEKAKTKGCFISPDSARGDPKAMIQVDIGGPMELSLPFARDVRAAAQGLAREWGGTVTDDPTTLDGVEALRVRVERPPGQLKPVEGIVCMRDGKVYLIAGSSKDGTAMGQGVEEVRKSWKWVK